MSTTWRWASQRVVERQVESSLQCATSRRQLSPGAREPALPDYPAQGNLQRTKNKHRSPAAPGHGGRRSDHSTGHRPQRQRVAREPNHSHSQRARAHAGYAKRRGQ